MLLSGAYFANPENLALLVKRNARNVLKVKLQEFTKKPHVKVAV